MTDTMQKTEDSSKSDIKTNSDNKNDDSFGISDGSVPDNCMFSSSVLNQSCGANQARLHKQPYKEKYGAWTPLYNDKNQYLDIDLGEEVQIGAIATQGRPAYTEDGGWYVESYSLAYGNDGDDFQNLREYGISKVFEGNKDPETVVKNQFRTGIKCRWVRIKPVTWHNHAALRVELYRFTGKPQNPRKSQANQKLAQKSTSDRGAKQNARVGRPEIVTQVKEPLPNGSSIRINDSQQICIVDATKEETKAKKEVEKAEINTETKSYDSSGDQNLEQVSDIVITQQGSFEVIENAMEEQVVPEKGVLHNVKKGENNNEEKAPEKGVIIGDSTVNVQDRGEIFKNRPTLAKVDPTYHATIRGASAVATRSDGSKFIGKIKLIKKEEELPEKDDVEETPQHHGPDYVVPDVVKERLGSYQEVILRNKENRSNETASNRKSLALEEDLRYLDEMESSVFDRLRQFKDIESKTKENQEMSKQEEEKRQSMKRDGEKRRSMILQKEKERILDSLQKQKEEEEEQRRKREEAEADELAEIEEDDGRPEVPAVVNERLRIFKEGEQKEKEEHEVMKAEAEKRRLAKEDGERKRRLAEEKERERLQEAIHKRQKELEEQRLLRGSQSDETNGSSDVPDGSEETSLPAIVHDRIKMFKDGEKANKDKQEALRIEAQKRRAAAEEAERSRILAEEKNRQEIPITRIDETIDLQQEEIVVAEENFVVESEVTFDFMEPDVTKDEASAEEVLGSEKKTQDVNRKESLDLQTKLQGIDTHHDGYDPDHERQMLEEAEEAFRTYAAHQKGGNKSNPSNKTQNLIRSFTVDSSTCNEPSSTRDNSNIVSPRNPVQKAKSVDEYIDETRDESKDACLKGLVKDRANIFLMHTPPDSGEKTKTSHAQVKKWIASQPHTETEAGENERVLLNSQLADLERKSKSLNEEVGKLKSQGKDEEALELEEDFHSNSLEISKIKKKLLKIEKEQGGLMRRATSESSETRSVTDDVGSDRASSSGSRSAHKGGSLKLSRECKAPVDKPLPPVDVNSYNDDGDIVIEGNVLSQIKNYEEESARQRKKMAEIRKSLSLSRSSMESFESPPPMGYGGPDFAKEKAKLSRECKLQRDTPVPPVDQGVFNEDGDCVPEGNVLQQIKTFSKS